MADALGPDIYSPHVKNHELFTKTDMNERGEGDGGILFERDPARHRLVSKQLSPAFSSRASMAKEPVMQMYIDLFVDNMRRIGPCAEGVDVSKWCNWLAMDTSADLAYNRKMDEMRDSKQSRTSSSLLLITDHCFRSEKFGKSRTDSRVQRLHYC